MILDSYFGSRYEDLPGDRWDLAVTGDAVDDRGLAAAQFARSSASTSISASYDPQTLEIEVNKKRIQAEAASTLPALTSATSILLEATTLGFVEVFLFLRAALEHNIERLGLLYVEPAQYRSRERSHVLTRRDFELTDEVDDFSGIPGAAFIVRPEETRAVFLLGFEGQRLDQALEQIDLKARLSNVVFGVPAFIPGWEMDAFANNVKILKERRIESVLFAAANDPSSAYRALKKVHSSCSLAERLLIAPVGTKPHGVGAALFAARHPDVGLVYDHPKRSTGRSTQTGTWHLHIQEKR